MTDLLAGSTIQLQMFRRAPGYLLLFIAIPFFALIFVSVARYEHDPALIPKAILAPGLMGVWMTAVALADMIVTMERAYGTLEIGIAAPGNLSLIITGRVLTVTTVGLSTVLESILFSWLVFGETIHIYHPWVFALSLALNAAATASTATIMTSLFLAFRAASRYVNALGYPFYLLGGVILPASLLPAWIRPVSFLIYLRWTSQLLYASVAGPPAQHVLGSVAAVVVIGGASYGIGDFLLRKTIDRLRVTGTAGLS